MECIVTFATDMYSYLSEVSQRYKVLKLDAIPRTVRYCERGHDPWLFLEARRGLVGGCGQHRPGILPFPPACERVLYLCGAYVKYGVSVSVYGTNSFR
jgi:hypothetical protein